MKKLAEKLGDNGIYNPFDLQNINNQQIYNYDDEIQYQPINYLSDFLNYGKVTDVIAFMYGYDVWFVVSGYVNRTTTDAYGNPIKYKKEGWIYVRPQEVNDYNYVLNLIQTNSVRWKNNTGKSNPFNTNTTNQIEEPVNIKLLSDFKVIKSIVKMRDYQKKVYYAVIGYDKNDRENSLSVYENENDPTYKSIMQIIEMYKNNQSKVLYKDMTYDDLPENKIIDIYPENKKETTYNDQIQIEDNSIDIKTTTKTDVLPNQYQDANFLTIETILKRKTTSPLTVIGFVLLFLLIAFLIWFYVFKKDKSEKNPFKWLYNQFKKLFKGRKQ